MHLPIHFYKFKFFNYYVYSNRTVEIWLIDKFFLTMAKNIIVKIVNYKIMDMLMQVF